MFFQEALLLYHRKPSFLLNIYRNTVSAFRSSVLRKVLHCVIQARKTTCPHNVFQLVQHLHGKIQPSVVHCYKNSRKRKLRIVQPFTCFTVVSICVSPSSEKYSHCIGTITPSLAVSAFIVSIPSDGGQSIKYNQSHFSRFRAHFQSESAIVEVGKLKFCRCERHARRKYGKIFKISLYYSVFRARSAYKYIVSCRSYA